MTSAARAVTTAIALFVLVLLAGCAPALRLSPTTATETLPREVELTDVPFYPQERYYCGPASLAMVLAWSGLAVGPDDLVPQVYTRGREGTLRTDIPVGGPPPRAPRGPSQDATGPPR
ncbi:MAG: C39 family peptidase [Candidatus Rokuibacteriota bacterium]